MSAKHHQMALMFHMVTLYVKMHPLKKYLLDIKKKVGPAAPYPHLKIIIQEIWSKYDFIVQNPLKLETVQTLVGFLRAAFQPSEYFQHFILKKKLVLQTDLKYP